MPGPLLAVACSSEQLCPVCAAGKSLVRELAGIPACPRGCVLLPCSCSPSSSGNSSSFPCLALPELLDFWGESEEKAATTHLCFLGFLLIGLIAITFISHNIVQQGCNFPIIQIAG